MDRTNLDYRKRDLAVRLLVGSYVKFTHDQNGWTGENERGAKTALEFIPVGLIDEMAAELRAARETIRTHEERQARWAALLEDFLGVAGLTAEAGIGVDCYFCEECAADSASIVHAPTCPVTLARAELAGLKEAPSNVS